MKIFLLLSCLVASTITAYDFLELRKKPKPAPVVVEEDDDDDDDEDEKVVLANIGNMLQSIGTLSTDPANPAVAGPAIASFGMSFVNILVQMFKGIDIRGGQITHEQIEQWFKNLPESTQQKLVTLLIIYAQEIHNHAIE